MRVLFFTYYFPPLGGMGSIRATGLARHLAALGFDVTVIAPRTGSYALDSSLRISPAVRVVRTGTLEPGILLGRGGKVGPSATAGGGEGARSSSDGVAALARSVVRRLAYVPDPNVGWVPAAVRAGIREAARVRPDAIFSSSPPVSAHLAAAWVASRTRVPRIADCRDFLSASRLFGGLRGRLDARLERRALRGTAGFTAPYSGILERLQTLSDAPGLVVRNGFEEDDFTGPAPSLPTDRVTAVHVGNTWSTQKERRDPAPLLAAIADVRREGIDLRPRFVGALDSGLRRAVSEAGLDDVLEATGFVCHADAVDETRAASVLLLPLWGLGGDVSKGLVPGKTFEYLRTGRPVLALADPGGDAARLLHDLGGAVVRSADDRPGIADALRTLLRGEGPPPVSQDRLRRYSVRSQAARLAAWLPEIVG